MLITHLLPLRTTGMGTILDNETMVNGMAELWTLAHRLRLLLLEQVSIVDDYWILHIGLF